MNEPSQTHSATPKTLAVRLVRTGLLMAGSALLGGLAVVLWHRRSLASLRQPVIEPNRSPIEPDAETE